MITLTLEHVGYSLDRNRPQLEYAVLHGHRANDAMRKVFGVKSRRPWVALLSLKDGRLDRTFLEGPYNFSGASKSGQHGVTRSFHLELDRVYEVSYYSDWYKHVRYFCRVTMEGVEKLTREEVIACLSA